MQDPENIRRVAELHPNLMGFIFYNGSPRFVGNNFMMPELASEIDKVGVFVNESIENVIEIAVLHELNFVQLHGDESSGFCEELSQHIAIIKAFGVDEDFDFNITNKYELFCTYFLFDTKTADHGGSGRIFDWSLLEKYKGSVPYFISGGLGIEEIEGLNKHFTDPRLYALDVNSRFETGPGMKDIEKIKQLTAKTQRR